MDNKYNLSSEQIELFKEACLKLVTAIKKAWGLIVKVVKIALRVLLNMPGYKRLRKKNELMYYRRISTGRTNNWRRVHGLPSIRMI